MALKTGYQFQPQRRSKPQGAVAFAKIGVALTYNRRRRVIRPTLLDNNMMSASTISKDLNQSFLYHLLQTIDFNTVSAGSALPYLTVGL